MSAAGTYVFTDPFMLQHEPGAKHPESPSRLKAVLNDLTARPISRVTRGTPRQATDVEMKAVHTPGYLDRLRAFAGKLTLQLDPDTVAGPASFEAARLAAGATVAAVTTVWTGDARNAFAVVRPPGHHAEPAKAMGFCILNNIAIAAEAARRLGAKKIMVLDWDVHHGNGTQKVFESRRDVLFVSSHRFPFYPGTGAPHEIGTGEGTGFTVNCALRQGQDDADYGPVFNDLFLPIGRAFKPDIVLVSAGFDAHARDPMGGMKVTERGFAAMCSAVKALAEECCGGKLVLALEGGYDLTALAGSVRACLEVLVGRTEAFPPGAQRSAEAVAASRKALAGHWKV